MRAWSVRLREGLWKHLWTGVSEHKGRDAMETHLYPVLKELKLTPDQVVVGLHSRLRPPKSGDQAYLTFHTLNYSIYPQLMTAFFGLPVLPAKAGWNKWITDMQPFLEGLTTPVEVEAYRRWLADQEPEEEEEPVA